MNKSLSVYLDAVRFLAAIGVFFSHFVMSRWTGGVFPERLEKFIELTGVDLVMVFFVLSGFVIAYTVDVKDRIWDDYVFSRATRMYSVAAPAIIAGFLLDRTGVALNPADYQGWWYVDHSFLNQLVRGLTFSNELWRGEFRMGTNGPFWSLGYEVWYYVLFGLLAFARGWGRIVALLTVALLVGTGIILLAPVWAAGALLYRALQRGWFNRFTGPAATVGGAIVAVAPILVYAVLRAGSADDVLRGLSAAMFADAGRAQYFLWDWTVGGLVVAHFAGVALVLRNLPIAFPGPVAKPVRWLAGASFSIYVVHYPALQAIDALLVGDPANPWRVVALAVSALAFCFMFAAIFERRLSTLRAWLRALPTMGAGERQPAFRFPVTKAGWLN